MELILKAKDIRVEFKGRTCLDIDELVSLTNSTQNRKAMRRKLSGLWRVGSIEEFEVSYELTVCSKIYNAYWFENDQCAFFVL